MARNWNALSPAYRKRLQNAGITQNQYESGAKLSQARGHAQTPEHPSDVEKHPGKYRRYEQSRTRLTKLVIEKKKTVFGSEERFYDLHSRDYVHQGVPHLNGFDQRKPLMTELRAMLKMTADEMYEKASAASRSNLMGRKDDLEYSALWYH